MKLELIKIDDQNIKMLLNEELDFLLGIDDIDIKLFDFFMLNFEVFSEELNIIYNEKDSILSAIAGLIKNFVDIKKNNFK